MARSSLTLAALATSAVEGLNVRSVHDFTSSTHGDFDSALLTTHDGTRLVIRVPTSESATQEQLGDTVALGALTAGIRSRLPFDLHNVVGQMDRDGIRAVVYEYLEGERLFIEDVSADSGVADSVGRAIGAVHSLPASFVQEAGLPVSSAQESLNEAVAVSERAADTGHVPAALVARWESASSDEALWQFDPTVIHGSMTADSFLRSGDAVSAVLGWAALQVGDPARDVHWLLSASGCETALSAYSRMRAGTLDRTLRQRAQLYAELELARWLLHGVESNDSAIVDDAVGMLDVVVDSVLSDLSAPLSIDTGTVLEVSEVEELLNRTPGARTDSPLHGRGLAPVTEDSDAASSRSE
ncbi:phosphotransferase [Rathayibacter toxicus]|uniref:Macrolide 2'-phosphotransferase n=1 Tax=Rathayibacter toxicus TaxID=145458 RepID=A0A0C5B910_9MICO|nr:phosphotransferase [Rathayibacter toxicus]AJM77333.1 macrolide 2'-phosphotransferase [Rathayibacter toxicus]ALS56788.1 macrolide 2'-phosphotransferase [Rathayibacter toxicus]KKM46366.1 macrolide 2'-phosphotransferase [Rathayibacter toxicus]PPG23349.1 macrolide 2'-phosphotransferase [Rathayibacter toxicus]PPG47933.1 macrolide 2'-phosphotransferase [Rathayibacter toxicus]